MSVGDVRQPGSAAPIRRFVLLLLLPLSLALAGCATSAPHAKRAVAAAAPGTTTVRFQAYTPAGRLTVPVQDVARGQCWTTSIAAPTARAYRCFEGNKILDPCFAPAHPTSPVQLACLATPWSRALMLQVTDHLPAPSSGGSSSRPWAIELSSGLRCVASTGTVPAVAGVNLAYHCTDGGDAALGSVAGARLTAQYAAPTQGPPATTLETMTVTTVWVA